MQKKLLAILAVVLVLAVVLGACTTTEVTPETIVETVVVTEEVETVVTEIVEVEAEVERKGAWLDTVVMIAEPSTESAVARIIADDIDVYANTCSDAEAFTTVQDEGLSYVSSVGTFNELTLNPSGPVLNDGTLNPFGVAAIREALNMAVDRDYIVQEIMGGLAIAKYLMINGVFPDYANFADVARELENKYAYDLDAADATITTEMEALGAEKVDGIWTYEGEPVTLIFLIRTEDERMQIGDYVSDQLEALGFTVDRQYKTSSEASPLWLQSDPAEGLWHIYTGGWISTAIDRDDGDSFQFYYSPSSAYGFTPLWQAYTPTDEFEDICTALANNDFNTLEERAELFEQALYLSMEESTRIWLVDQTAFSPLDTDVTVTYDLAGAISGTPLAAHTLRYTDEVGGELTLAMSDLFVDPWNPIGGSNWVYDQNPINYISDFGGIYDPYTGLYWPQRFESATVTAVEGLPIGSTLDWVTLEFVEEIEVPGDAWVDWDATNQVFITADEKLVTMADEAAAAEAEAAEAEEAEEAEEGEEEAEEVVVEEVPEYFTAKVKSTVVYPEDLWDTVTYHDGNSISMADFVMAMILMFDQGKEDSPYYDESQASALESFMEAFKGMKIVSTDPLTIEYYTDAYQLDAELNVESFYPGSVYDYGDGSFQMISIGLMAEGDGTLAFTADKADELEIEWLSYVSGPSLEILKADLETAIETGFIPYEATLGQYITAEEATERYENLLDFYSVNGHFYAGSGPYYLSKLFTVEKTLTLTRYQDYADDAGKWDTFGEPQIAEVEVDGSARVTIGEEATFDAYITFNGEAYSSADMDEVKYLLFDATGTLVDSGTAEFVEEGVYSVTFSADVTGALEAGSNKLEIVAVPLVVSIPTFTDFEFVTE